MLPPVAYGWDLFVMPPCPGRSWGGSSPRSGFCLCFISKSQSPYLRNG